MPSPLAQDQSQASPLAAQNAPGARAPAPPDFTNAYNTQLTPQQEQQFQAWAKKEDRLNDLAVYDLRGWWKAGAKIDPASGHFTDQFKKPSHPTFSDESIYHGVDGFEGGHWTEQPKGQWSYRPSSTNLQMNGGPQGLQDYFQRVEPSVRLEQPTFEQLYQYRAPTPPDYPWQATPSGRGPISPGGISVAKQAAFRGEQPPVAPPTPDRGYGESAFLPRGPDPNAPFPSIQERSVIGTMPNREYQPPQTGDTMVINPYTPGEIKKFKETKGTGT
jgi:hypothetical protein